MEDSAPGGVWDVLASLVGFDAVPATWADEHDRADLYHRAFDAPEAYDVLWDAAVVEPDAAVRSWVVVQMIERVDGDRASAWLGLAPSPYARRRAAEVVTLRALPTSAFEPQQVHGWTDWMQRRVVAECRRLDVLEALASDGRSKRVRAAATAALRSAGGVTATPAGGPSR